MSAIEDEQRGRRVSERSEATRTALIDVATEMFASRGFEQTSMRDLAREGPVSMGAIYSHFKSKAALLVDALNARIAEDLEVPSPEDGTPVDHEERLTAAARDFPTRRRLRALLVQAAAASQTDEQTRTAVRDAQEEHVARWVAGYEANRERLGLDDELDIRTAVLYIWATELGLGVLEAFGMAPGTPDAWADVQNRVARSLELPSHRHKSDGRRSGRP